MQEICYKCQLEDKFREKFYRIALGNKKGGIL
jgi:hypothetical protein